MHKRARALRTALLALLVVAFSATAAQGARQIIKKKEYEGPPAGPYRLGGLSFITERNIDVLRMHAPAGVVPEVYRHAVPQRVVLRFDNTQPLESLTSLLDGKRGDCVEKFEVHTLRNYAVGHGDMAGVRQFSEFSTLVIAYIPSDVDAQVTTDAGVVEVVFQRIHQDATQLTPPINILEEIYFEAQSYKEIVTFVFAQPVTPTIYEEVLPHRLLLRFPEVDMSIRAQNRIRRFMQTPLLFRIEAFNVGSMPLLYPEMDTTREYHFTSFPSPMADDAYADKIFGKQTRDIVVALYPFDKSVMFERPEIEANSVRITFVKSMDLEPAMVCTEFQPVQAGPTMLYTMEDEHGIIIEDEE